MSLLDSQLASDAAFLMADVDAIPGSEPVVYKKRTGATHNINAVVDRNPPQRVRPDGTLDTPRMTVRVANHATYGITATEVDAQGADVLTIADRVGGTAQDFPIYVPDPTRGGWQNAGFLTLELR